MARPHLKLSATEIGLTLAGCAALIWGAWVTQTIVTKPKQAIVKLNLAGLVQEYMAAAAHSNWTQDQIAGQTKQFTSDVDDEISQLSANGKTVLMTEAVLSKDVEDVTPQVRADIQKRVAWPVAMPNPGQLTPAPASQAPAPTSTPTVGGSDLAHP